MFLVRISSYNQTIGEKTKEIKSAHLFEIPHAKNVIDLFLNIELILSEIPDSEKTELHYPLAEYLVKTTNTNWTGKQFTFQGVIPFDIDECDYERVEEYIDAFCSVIHGSRTKVGIVKSGHGLQFVVKDSKGIGSLEDLNILKDAYVSVCEKISNSLLIAGLPGKVDINVFRDKATLRLPLSYRADNGYHVELLNRSIDDIGFSLHDWMPNGSTVEEFRSKKGYRDKYKVSEREEFSNYDEIRTEDMIQGCEFLKHCRDNPKDVNYQQWFAMISTMSHAPSGEELIHLWSQPHSEYDPSKTQSMIHDAKSFGKPRTCASIGRCFDCSASGCLNFGKVKSPASIKGDNWIKTEHSGFYFYGSDGKRGRPDYVGLQQFMNNKQKIVMDFSGVLYRYNGVFWEVLTNSESFLRNFALTHFDPLPDDSIRSSYVSFVYDSNYNEGLTMNVDSNFINFRNGVLDVENRTLMPHDPKYMMNYVLDYDYDDKAVCTTYDWFLKDIFSDKIDREEIAQYMNEFIAYGLFAMKPIHHKALMLIGSGSNGKSVFLGLVSSLFDSRVVSYVPFGKLGDERFNFNLVNKLINLSDETVNFANDTAVSDFKKMTNGEVFNARKLYKDVVEVKDSRTKFIFSTNEYPNIKDKSNAVYRRIDIASFDRVYSGDGQIKDLQEKLREERSGIFNKILKAKESLEKRGKMLKPSSFVKAVEMFRENNNIAFSFFRDALNIETSGIYSLKVKTITDMMKKYEEENSSFGYRGEINRKNIRNILQPVMDTYGCKFVRKKEANYISNVTVKKEFLEDYGLKHLFTNESFDDSEGIEDEAF